MKRRWLLLAIPVVLIVASAAVTRPRPTMREQIEREFPGMSLVARKVDPWSGEISYLYTGQADSEAVSSHLDHVVNGPGWGKARRKVASAFPYVNHFSSLGQLPFWYRFAFSRSLTYRWFVEHPSIELRVLKGRAGAPPEGGPWSSLLIREHAAGAYTDMSEPILGYGVQL